ncbi:MAG TPA: serine/threonine-protein kinase [Actinospica sp.]|nr:serine/threonine-protein kinase [Actinospica sp.]
MTTAATDGAEMIAGRYRRISRVGGGAMGVVWSAHDEVLGRTVAVKQLRASIGLSSSQIEQAHSRARREARIAARLQHPHAVTVFDVVDHEGRPCLVMEYVPSRSLAQILAEDGGLPGPEVARLGARVASALIAAHRAGIVHRDIKPGNILIGDDGSVKLTDFGISRAIDDVTLTATGEMLGTPAYISPEIARSRGADAASDVFSLGATLYAALEGVPPFGTGPTAMALLMRITNNDLREPLHEGAPMDTLLWMLSPYPENRPGMDVVRRRLESVANEPPPIELPDLEDRIGATATAEPPTASAAVRRARLLTGVLLVVAAALTATAVTVLIAHGRSGASNAATEVGQTKAAGATTSATELQMTAAISRYYRLVPDHLSESWQSLTPEYQRSHANGLSSYRAFWDQIRSVSISGIAAAPPSDVVVTIDYVYKTGETVRERTILGLVEQDGDWKIADSSVLSSTTL